MSKKNSLWFTLMLTAMLLLRFSMNTYAGETNSDTTESMNTAEASYDTASEANHTAPVIIVGEADETQTKEEAAEEAFSEEASFENTDLNNHIELQSLGMFRTTAYCPCHRCSEGWGRATSTGATAQANHTIAVDPRVIPYGTRLMIDGIIYTAEDRGGGVKGRHIDIFFDEHTQTRQHGSRQQEVFLVI